MISTDTSANVIEGSRASLENVRLRPRGPRFFALAALALYLGVSGALLGAKGYGSLAVMHVVGVAMAFWANADRGRVARVVGDLLPLIAAPMLYGEIPLLIAALGTSYHDATVQRWELALFGAQASRVFATFVPSTAVSEIVHAGYLAYYPAIFVPPLLLYARGNRRGYGETVVALTSVYLVCWMIFSIAPVEGPRYLWTADAPDGPFRRFTVALLAAGSSRGAAFPSSHMAVSVTQAAMALRWQPRVGMVLVVVAALVGLGAVYGGFHYGVDIVAGAVLGLVLSTVTIALCGSRT